MAAFEALGDSKACIPGEAGLCSADMYPLTVTGIVDSRFLLLVLLSDYFTQFTVNTSLRVAMPKTNRDDLKNCSILLPPLAEQRSIVEQISKHIQRLDELRTEVWTAIDKLQEYRTALISAAVTGKIDVRGAV